MSTADQTPATQTSAAPAGVIVRGALEPRFAEILTPQALAFVAALHRTFDARRVELLQARTRAPGALLGRASCRISCPRPRKVREAEWRVAPIPADLLNRRVEITGPVDRKMIINALNCGANVFMADFEDANSPTWHNISKASSIWRDRWHRQHRLQGCRHRQAVRAERQARGADGPSARLAPDGAT